MDGWTDRGHDIIRPVFELGFTVLHCKMIRGFEGKIPGIWLPVHLPLFFRNQDMVGLIPTALENNFVGVEGLYDKINNTCPLLPHSA